MPLFTLDRDDAQKLYGLADEGMKASVGREDLNLQRFDAGLLTVANLAGDSPSSPLRAIAEEIHTSAQKLAEARHWLDDAQFREVCEPLGQALFDQMMRLGKAIQIGDWGDIADEHA